MRSQVLDIFAEYHDSDIDATTPITECVAMSDSRYIGRRYHYKNLLAVWSHERQAVTLFVDEKETVTMPAKPSNAVTPNAKIAA